MGHEIEKHDGLVLTKEKAWHNLGLIVEDCPSPAEALKLAKLDWTVESWPILARMDQQPGGAEIHLKKHAANIRSDTKTLLGIVGADYQPIQNTELADFCQALAENNDKVKVETAGSIRNGQKVWFLLRGESFSVRKDDEVKPYILVSNGHDGGTALRCTPTTIRVVCSNTLHAVIPSKFNPEGKEKLGQSRFIACHTKTIMERVEEAKKALQLYGRSIETTRQVIDRLAARDLNNEQVKRFLLECYARDFGPIPTEVTNEKEMRLREKAKDALRAMRERFEKELQLAGATAWNAMNAYTGWLQHDRPNRIKNVEVKAERKMESQLFGVDADRGYQTLMDAVALAT